MYGAMGAIRHVWKAVRKYGPLHLMRRIRVDNAEREEWLCGGWGQQYRRNDNGDLECVACRKKAGLK